MPYLVAIYTLIRILSFLTSSQPLANSFIAAVLVIAFSYLCLKNLKLAWLVLIAELLLGGSGHYFELFGLILRTWFLGIFAVVWFVNTIKQRFAGKGVMPYAPTPIIITMAVSGIFILISVITGFLNGHSPILIAQDLILYLFVLLLFPALEMREGLDKKFNKIIRAFILGSALFSLLTLIVYSAGIGILQDSFYHWFRDIAGGKITDLGNNFFRVVLSEHLLLVPILLVIGTFLMKNPKDKKLWFYAICIAFALALNFTRIYFIGLAVGLLILLIKQNFKRWLLISASVVVSIFLFFISTHFISSRGQSLGLQLVGIKIGGVTTPATDVSGAIRLALLPDIYNRIKFHPWIGNGLGTTVSFIHPITKDLQTRTQFDWGYFEMLAELGILGTLSYLAFLIVTAFYLARSAYPAANSSLQNPLLPGLLAGIVSLFIINITTPALFQGFGVLYFVLVLVVLNYEHHQLSFRPKPSTRLSGGIP